MTLRSTKSYSTDVKVTRDNSISAYTLEFLSSTKRYPVGAAEPITLPYIELGRENCQINFGNELTTVSRKHAAIIRNGSETVVKNLSQTNQTLVNGRPVIDQYFLKSGDEIQLSLEGPRLRFIEGRRGTVKSGSEKMNLLVKQAMLPYKKALLIVAIIFLLAILTGAYFLFIN